MLSLWDIVIIVLGLCLFEVINSIDNAIINAEVLNTMSARARKWFLLWGIIAAVFLVRGLLPLIILWVSNPQLSIPQLFTAAFSSDPAIAQSMQQSAPLLLMGGGVFLVLLFFHWLFVEPKNYGLFTEKYIHKYAIWFYAFSSIFLTVLVWYCLQLGPMYAFAAVLGSAIFFITHGFKQNAENMEERMLKQTSGISDLSKLMYLEVIDATFSIDGVLGAFAFTLSIPLILIGNGLGAWVVRTLTVKNIHAVKKYKYLKNGAMYSIFALGIIMILDGFGHHIPSWLSPVMTFVIVGYFFFISRRELKKEKA
jgi:uncharacterized protein